jgi:hypothetical protein
VVTGKNGYNTGEESFATSRSKVLPPPNQSRTVMPVIRFSYDLRKSP